MVGQKLKYSNTIEKNVIYSPLVTQRTFKKNPNTFHMVI